MIAFKNHARSNRIHEPIIFFYLTNQSKNTSILWKWRFRQKKLFWKNNALFLYNQNLIFKILIGKLNYMDTLVLPLNKID